VSAIVTARSTLAAVGGDRARAVQHALYRAAKADPDRRFHALFDKAHRRDVLDRAWENVRRNRGAAGIDRVSLADAEEYGVTRLLGEPIAQRSARVLLGWLSPKDAINQLLGRNPMPQEDLTAVNQLIASTRSAVLRRPPTVIGDPLITGDRSLLDQVADRPRVQAAFADVPWRVQWVDLTQVLSVQKMITTDGLEARVAQATADHAALVELCLPAAQPVPPLAAFGDPDGHGFALSSLNPNLRVVGSSVAEALVSASPQLPPQKVQAYTFFVSMGASYVQVAQYEGRSFLRDGYHRAAGLLRAGVSRVPAVVIDAPSFQFITSAPGLFDYEVAFSDHAPGWPISGMTAYPRTPCSQRSVGSYACGLKSSLFKDESLKPSSRRQRPSAARARSSPVAPVSWTIRCTATARPVRPLSAYG
jgi:hypothetical protein